MGRGVEGHSAWQGASRRPSQSRNWERVMCRGLAQHCWQLKPVDIWRKVPKQHSVWLYLPAEQTLADWNSHLGSHQLKQAWPRLSVDLLGHKWLCLPRPGCGKQDPPPTHRPPTRGSGRAVPRWLAYLHPASWVVWGCSGIPRTWAQVFWSLPGPPPALVGRNMESKARGIWKVAGLFFFFFLTAC